MGNCTFIRRNGTSNGAWLSASDVSMSNTLRTYVDSSKLTYYVIEVPATPSAQSSKTISVTTRMGGFTSTKNIAVTYTITSTERTSGTSIPSTVLGSTTVTHSIGADGMVSATINFNDTNNSSHYIYLWVTSSSSSIINILGNNSSYTATANLSYTAYSAVTSPSVTASSTIIRPDGSVTVNWSGGAGGNSTSIASYSLNIRKNSASGTVLYTKTGISASSTSLTVALSDFSTKPARGDTLYATIQAISSPSGYSGTVNSNKVAVINVIPNAPTITQTGTVVAKGRNVSFAITAGSDSNSQTTSVYYWIQKGEEVLKNTTISGTLSITIDNISNYGITEAGDYTVHFRSWDGLEWSSDTIQNFSVQLQPSITSSSASATLVADGSGTKNLVTAAALSFTLKTNITSPIINLKVYTGSSSSNVTTEKTIPTGSYTISGTGTTKTISIDTINISTSYIPRGYYFKFGYTISDEYDTTEMITTEVLGRRPYLPKNPTSPSITTDGNSNAKSGYFGSKLYVTYTNPAATAGYADIKAVSLTAGGVTRAMGTTEGARVNKHILDLSSLTAGTSVSVSIKITDVVNQVTTYNFTNSYIKSEALSFSGSVNINPSLLKPLSMGDSGTLSILYPNAASNGSNNIEYKYSLSIENGQYYFLSYGIDTTQPEGTNGVNIIYSYLKEILASWDPSWKYRNEQISAKIIVTAVDGFNQEKNLEAGLTLNFREAPYWPSNATFKILHDYYTSSTSVNTLAPEVPTYLASDGELNLDVRIFNKKEGYIFKFPTPVDLNNDITEYRIYLARNDLPLDSTTILASNKVTFSSSPWKTVPISSCTISGDYTYCHIKASDYQKNEYFYFKIVGVDSTGLTTSELVSNTFAIGGRVSQAVFTLDNFTVTRNSSNMPGSVSFNMSISDLGGSSSSNNSWTKEYYLKYPNLNRYYSGLLTQSEGIILEYEYYGTDASTIWTGSKVLPWNNIFQYDNITFEVDPSFTDSKIFVKVKIKIQFGQYSAFEKEYLSSAILTYADYGDVPTLKYKKSKVGINTSTLLDEDVFVVERNPATNGRYIKFVCDNGDNTIKIDLGDDGGIIINCGSW